MSHEMYSGVEVIVELWVLRSPHEIWTVLMWVTSPVPGGFACTRLKRLSGAHASQCWSIAVFRKAAIDFAFVAVTLCLCVITIFLLFYLCVS